MICSSNIAPHQDPVGNVQYEPPPRPADAPASFMKGRSPIVDERAVKEHSLGSMCHKCSCCNAKHFMHERHIGSTVTGTATFSQCCRHGKIKLPALRPTPPVLSALLCKRRAEGVQFLQQIRSYNGAFQMASSGKLCALHALMM